MSGPIQYVFNPFSPVPTNKKSHVRGWALHWADILGGSVEVARKDTDLSNAELLLLDHGVNFSGSLNLFGGVDDDVCNRLEQILDSTAMLVSLDIPMPDYVDQLEKRLGQSTCSPRLAPLLKALRTRFESARCYKQEHIGLKKLTIGDSHSTAFAPSGSAVLRHNGQTLFGALRDGLIEKSVEGLSSVEELTLVFGSIDLRHHIGRRDDPLTAIQDLAEEYATLAANLAKRFKKVEVAYAMPIEYEGRKIPQTGFYQGTPFAGSRDERREWTAHFGLTLDMELGADMVFSPPQEWYGMDGEEFATKYMELSSSVHLSPESYRRKNWGI